MTALKARTAQVSSCVLLIAMLAVGSGARAETTLAATSCHRIHAKGLGQDVGNGTTHAQISGGGLLHGTTQGNLAIIGAAGTVLTVDGTVAFTPNRATLTVHVTGPFDISNGVFSLSGPVISATGRLAGATGILTLGGVENTTTGQFSEEVTGRICVDLGP
jgi:hypothetical protein